MVTVGHRLPLGDQNFLVPKSIVSNNSNAISHCIRQRGECRFSQGTAHCREFVIAFQLNVGCVSFARVLFIYSSTVSIWFSSICFGSASNTLLVHKLTSRLNNPHRLILWKIRSASTGGNSHFDLVHSQWISGYRHWSLPLDLRVQIPHSRSVSPVNRNYLLYLVSMRSCNMAILILGQSAHITIQSSKELWLTRVRTSKYASD